MDEIFTLCDSVTVSLHDELRIGTLSAILTEVEQAHALTRDELLERLFN